jgi:hypothetical protein
MNFRYVVNSITISALWCFPVAVLAVSPAEQDPLAAMQQVIDQQRAELEAQSEQLEDQSEQLKSQQQRLDKQQEMLESMQSQLQVLSREKTAESKVAAVTLVEERRDSDASDDEPAGTAGETPAPVPVQSNVSISDQHRLALDSRPLDVPDDTGTVITSRDGSKRLRIYGSIRALAVLDNRQNFHPYDLNIPQVPYGDADFTDWNQDFTMNTSKFGFQVGINEKVSLLSEFDFKGESGDALRIRHMYGRTDHWLVGKHWTIVNSTQFLPLAIDSHGNGAHLGARKTQVKYIGAKGNWDYQASLENFQPQFDEPDSLDTSKRNLVPNIGANASYHWPWGMTRFAAMLTSNRVRFDQGEDNRTTSSDTGLLLLAGIRAAVSENNTIKAHVVRTDGNTSLVADYAFDDYDMVFNPLTGEFENLESWGAEIALEHHWTPTLSTTVGGGYISLDSRSFQPGGAFDHGYKALANLFYRPGGWLKGLTLAGEIEFAGLTTLDGSRGDTTRISVLLYYDF